MPIAYFFTTPRANDVEMSSFQGQLKNLSLKQIERAFGPASIVRAPLDNYKTDAEWAMKFHDADNTIATIYNWKNGRNYLGSEGLDVEDVVLWHVGGFSPDAVTRVCEVLEAKGCSTFQCVVSGQEVAP